MALSFTLKPFGRVSQALKKLEASDCRTYEDYKKVIIDKLRNELSNKEIIEDHKSGAAVADLLVGNKVPVLLQGELKSIDTLYRIIGWIEHCRQEWNGVVLVQFQDITSGFDEIFRDYTRLTEADKVYIHLLSGNKCRIITRSHFE